MSLQNSNFNQFNELLERYLENVMHKYFFGICITESIPYGLETKNTKAVQLLEKPIEEKLDN